MVICIFLFFSAPLSVNRTSEILILMANHKISQISHDSLYISSDGDFEFYDFPGSGTAENPYIIENLLIGSLAPCLSISYTTAHFVVRNCIFEAERGSLQNVQGMIRLQSVQNGIVEDCLLVGGDIGIYILGGSNIAITNCSMSDIGMISIYQISGSNCSYRDNVFDSGGILLFNANSIDQIHVIENCTIAGNEIGYFGESENMMINGSKYSQIIISDCNNVTVDGLVSSNVTAAVQIYDSTECSLYNSHISALYLTSVFIINSRNLTIKNNSFENEGIMIEGEIRQEWIHDIQNNTVDGSDIHYFRLESDITLENQDFGQLFFVNCTDVLVNNSVIKTEITAIFCSEIRIANTSIPSDSNRAVYIIQSVKISIQDCMITSVMYISDVNEFALVNCTISSETYGCIVTGVSLFVCQNCSFTTSLYGIVAYNLIDGHILSNDFTYQGLQLQFVEQVEIIENTFHNCRSFAIVLAGNAIQIASNEFDRCSAGIYAANCWFLEIGDMEFTDMDAGILGLMLSQSEIQGCTILRCGISLSFIDCYDVNISSCTIEEAGYNGLSISNSTEVNIANLSIIASLAAGVDINYGSYCTICNCNISSCESGIRVVRSIGFQILECSIKENEANGITLNDCGDTSIRDSNISENGHNGIELVDSTESWIIGNWITNNSYYGIHIIGSSRGSMIYYNHFILNGEGNAFDSCGDNTWDDCLGRGNYWDDWEGYGYYLIPGSTNSVDHYPMSTLTLEGDILTQYGPTLIAMTVLCAVILVFVHFQKRRISYGEAQ